MTPVDSLDVLKDLECLKHVQKSLFYNWKIYLKPFQCGAAINFEEDKDE